MKALKIAVTFAIAIGAICSSPSVFAARPLNKNELKHAPKGCAYVLTAVPPGKQNDYSTEAGSDVIMCQTWLNAFRDPDAQAQDLAKMLENRGNLRMGAAYWQREAAEAEAAE